MADQNYSTPPAFTKRWQRALLGLFVCCWSTMLIPMLIDPLDPINLWLTLGLLGIGCVAVCSLIVSAMISGIRQ